MTVLILSLCLAGAEPLSEAQGHLNHGRYEEALEAFARAERAVADPADVALGVSRVRIETGAYDEAARVLDAALHVAPRNADLLARRGELRLIRGDVAGALRDAVEALEQEPEHVSARWVKADVLTETGRIDEATEECRWFVRHYNRTRPRDAETLVTIAKGSLRYARWKRVTPIFHFVVNELCRDIAKADPDDWRADAVSGALLLEKYNEAQGVPDLEKALAKNPNAAEVHVALAAAAIADRDFEKAAERIEAALAANPASSAALGLKADIAIAEGNTLAARETLKQALAVNPHDQETLARLVAVDVIEGEFASDAFSAALAAIEAGDAATFDVSSDNGRLVAELLRRNPKPGPFLHRLGATLERQRLYTDAERAFETASAVMPELSEPQVALALLAMRGGDFRRAKPILDAAFKADAFHVRVSNMRKVVGLLESYDEIETVHFVIRFDPAKDRVLAELAAEHLESAYPDLTGQFGYEPPEKTVVELFQTGRGQSGQQWFSARMVGLPWLQTVGASTGLMIALTAPTSGTAYNWAAVVRHEFVHVVTLQQTGFRVPHWYTEALAVRSEGHPRPELWDELLRRRVPKGELRTLDELNVPFSRPGSAADWQFAYCQSLLYAVYIDERFGSETHREMLAAYTHGMTTAEAIAQATGQSVEQFDSGYRERLTAIATELGPSSAEKPPADVLAVLNQVAAALREGDDDQAITLLEESLDRSKPQPQLLELLARFKLKAGDAADAVKLFALGRESFQQDRRWLKLLIAAKLRADDADGLESLLEELANTDPNDSLASKKLAELSHAAGDAAATRRWAMRAIHVAPNDAELHVMLAKAWATLGDADRAATARRHAAILKNERPPVDAEDK